MTNTNELTAKLKAAALAATLGPWRYQKTTPVTDAEISAENYTRVVNLLAGDVTPANSEFIALANPAAVLELIVALEAAQKRNAELEGQLEVSQHDLSDTEDAMHIWAERAKEAEGKALPVAYAPAGHIRRYLNGTNSACWVYANPTGEDDDVLFIAAPNARQLDRKTICEKVHRACSRTPGATFYNAAELALDEVESAAGAGINLETGGE